MPYLDNPRARHTGMLPGVGITGGALATLSVIDALLVGKRNGNRARNNQEPIQ